jgi:arylsulfatase A-like enzyme
MMKNLKPIIPILTFLSCLSACQMERTPDINQATPPNILLIMTDDMGYGDYSNMDNPYINTPNLDQMSRQSVNFKNFYVSSVCAPTRASLLTGRYHQRCGVRSVTNGYEVLDPDEHTLAELLKDKGYATSIFGKWHLGEYYPSLPNAQGFDEYFGFRTGHTDNYYNPVLEHNGKMEQTAGHITDILTDKAMAFMEANKKNPFFCYLAYNAPHSPLQVDSSRFVHFLEKGLNNKTSRVYGMVEQIDENIGRIFTMLNENQLIDNTIVLFLSDNGPISGWKIQQGDMRFNAGLRDQKFSIFEGGVRTQSYWYWKNQWTPKYDTTIIAAHIDVVPTLMDLISGNAADTLKLDGISLKNVLSGDDDIATERIYFENYSLETLKNPAPFPGGIARQGKWKMVNGSELYNLKTDPGEQHNLAEKHPDMFNMLKDAYLDYYHDSYKEGRFQPLPIKIGYPQENPVHIQPHHGIAAGNVQFLNPDGRPHPMGVDGNHLGSWKNKGDKVTWKLQSIVTSDYQVGLKLRGKLDGCTLRFSTNSETKEITLPNHKKSEDWTAIELTELHLGKDVTTTFSIELVNMDLDNQLEIREVIFEIH